MSGGSDAPLSKTAALETSNFTWDNNAGEYQYISGDFNGDGLTDLLALSVEDGEHLLYHFSAEAGFTLAQTIDHKSQWGRKKLERIIVDDFNNDGREDVFLLAKKSGKKHHVAYATEQGTFDKKSIESLKTKFTNYSWFDDEYSTNVLDIDGDGYKEILRMYNSPYMYDLEGNDVLMYEPEIPLDEPCKTVYYTVYTQQSGLYCPDGSKK